MDHRSILDQSLPSPAVEGNVSAAGAAHPSPPSETATANAHQPELAPTDPRFAEEDNGRSLAALAYRDLDAALQLLAERAQYITGASGAMIALRRGEHSDMVCRASAGSNAPELGALLSMEYGFSGESVRTRQALRCDDAELDPRVNREACHRLGISSVVAMPILSDQQVLGIFELFSDKPQAFAERDLSALQRLTEMVETAVKYAVAAQAASSPQALAAVEKLDPLADESNLDVEKVASPAIPATPDLSSAPTTSDRPISESENTNPEKTDLSLTDVQSSTDVLSSEKGKTDLPAMSEVAKKPIFWSVATHTSGNSAPTSEAAESMSVPAVLRNLQKCQACGFPVSQGRTFCVECEDKQWRGQRLPQPSASATQPARINPATEHPSETSVLKDAYPAQTSSAQTLVPTQEPTSSQLANPVPAVVTTAVPKTLASAPVPSPAAQNGRSAQDSPPVPDNAVLFLGSAAQSQSWFASNKYIVATLVVAAVIIAAIVLLR
jgi:GAF domain